VIISMFVGTNIGLQGARACTLFGNGMKWRTPCVLKVFQNSIFLRSGKSSSLQQFAKNSTSKFTSSPEGDSKKDKTEYETIVSKGTNLRETKGSKKFGKFLFYASAIVVGLTAYDATMAYFNYQLTRDAENHVSSIWNEFRSDVMTSLSSASAKHALGDQISVQNMSVEKVSALKIPYYHSIENNFRLYFRFKFVYYAGIVKLIIPVRGTKGNGVVELEVFVQRGKFLKKSITIKKEDGTRILNQSAHQVEDSVGIPYLHFGWS